MLPVDAHQGLVSLLRMPDFLRDAVLLPEFLDLPEPLLAEM